MRKKSDIATRIAASLALVLALSACSTPPTPSPEPTASGTGSTSGTPTSAPPPTTSAAPIASTPPAPDTAYQPATPTSPAKNVPKPVMPALAKEKSEAGQKAFIKYWLETYNYMRESGDASLFEAGCVASSTFCTGSIKNQSYVQRQKMWRIGGKLSATKSVAQPNDGTAGSASFILNLTEGSFEYASSSSESKELPSSSSKREYRASIDLHPTDNGWAVYELGTL